MLVAVAEESNHSDCHSQEQQRPINGWSIVVGSSEGEEWESCLLSVEELLNVEPFVCVFDCVGQQLNISLEELNLSYNGLTDEFTADDNFIHLGKLKKLGLQAERFSEAGFAAISLMIQVQFRV